MPTTYLTLTEVGELLGVSRQQVKKYILAGRIKAVEVAGRMVVEKRHAKKPAPRKTGPKPAD